MQSSGLKFRFIIALVFAAISIFGYYSKTQVNPITGEKQQVSLSPEQEVAMGLQSAPEMAAQYGGLHADNEVQELVKRVGYRLINSSEAKNSPYQFDFHALADDQTVNAFALPGGQLFITMGLLKRLKSEDQLAGVMGHEIGHVVGRHSAQQMAKSELTGGLMNAVVTATSDPYSGSNASAAVAQYVANVVNMKFGRNDELQSDELGVKYMLNAKYNPEAMIEVMQILKEASGGAERDEFTSSHPSPENRVAKIKEAIAKYK
jgi:predicted Zn-dependent protease